MPLFYKQKYQKCAWHEHLCTHLEWAEKMTWKIVEICRLLDEMSFFVIYMKRILVSSENNYLSWRGESWFNTQNHLAHNWLFIQYNNQHLNNLKVFVLLYKLIDAFFRGSYKNRKILFRCLIKFSWSMWVFNPNCMNMKEFCYHLVKSYRSVFALNKPQDALFMLQNARCSKDKQYNTSTMKAKCNIAFNRLYISSNWRQYLVYLWYHIFDILSA